MSEPTTSVAIGIGTASAITITGSFLGLQYELLLIGMLGGLIALSFMMPTSRRRMALAVASSALLAGYATPVLDVIFTGYIPSLKTIQVPLSLLMALLVGIAAQAAIPALMRKTRRWFGEREEWR